MFYICVLKFNEFLNSIFLRVHWKCNFLFINSTTSLHRRNICYILWKTPNTFGVCWAIYWIFYVSFCCTSQNYAPGALFKGFPLYSGELLYSELLSSTFSGVTEIHCFQFKKGKLSFLGFTHLVNVKNEL